MELRKVGKSNSSHELQTTGRDLTNSTKFTLALRHTDQHWVFCSS